MPAAAPAPATPPLTLQEWALLASAYLSQFVASGFFFMAMTAILRDRGVPRRNQLIIGYWHAGRAESEYSAESNHDRVADESMIAIPEASALTADSLGRAMRGTD